MAWAGMEAATPRAAPTASKPTTGSSKTDAVFTSDVGVSTEAYAKIYRMNEADRAAALAKLPPKHQKRYADLVSAYEKRTGSSK